MYLNKNTGILLLSIFILISQAACKKYLDATPDNKLVTPSTIQDLQALLDNYTKVNQTDAAAAVASADDYYVTTSSLSTIPYETVRRLYVWENDNLFTAGTNNDWSSSYSNIYTANLVLKHIDDINKEFVNEADFNNVKGQALFLRGRILLNIAQIWSVAFDINSASTDPGIPTLLDPDLNQKTFRPTLQVTYDQIIKDLKEASSLLPDAQIHQIRPSKAASYGLLARAYLAMREYDSCLKYSNLSLQLNNVLLNYNSDNGVVITPTGFSFLRFNKEVLYDACAGGNLTGVILLNSFAKVDSTLYKSYDVNDLRKARFFKSNNDGTYSFRGSYFGGDRIFTGIAVSEVYLMRAECYARENMIAEAMADLNTLMMKRWNSTVPFPTFTANNAGEALAKILVERRKELVFRGLRWMDIKRLNKDGANITIKRVVNNQNYILPPNDLRYALPIPEDVIAISGMPQNNRQ
jgi:tetratricopeptide (TPR) repeat protein